MSFEAAAAPARALMSVAQGLGEVGDVAMQFAQKVKQGKDAADVVRAKNIRLDAQAEFETWAATEQDETKWEEGNAQRVEKARAAIAGLKASRDAQARIDVDFLDWEGQRTTQVRNQALRQTAANANRDMQNAIQRMADMGNIVAVDEIIRQTVELGLIHDTEADTIRAKAHQRADRARVDKAMVGIGLLPLAEQIGALEKLREQVTADGTMNARVSLETIDLTTKALNQVQTHLDRNTLSLLTDLQQGDATIADVFSASEKGLVPEGLIGPEAMDPRITKASAEGQQRQVASATAQRETIRGQQHAAAGRYESLSKDVLQDFTAGDFEIQASLDRRDITPSRAEELRTRLEVLSLAQQSAPEEGVDNSYRSLKGRIDSLYTATALGYYEKSQLTDEQYRQLNADILDPKTRLTQSNKLDLMKRLYMAKLADIKEGEEDADTFMFDRRIVPAEKDMRVELLETIKGNGTVEKPGLLPALGLQQSGALLFSQEDAIRRLFDAGDPTPEQIQALKDQLTTQLKSAASQELIRSSFGF